ncbi:hypothetical protein [Streptomyces sp. MK5]|uniref:hypothetical protein n=1 Tax=Streptomyces sp. MK5 TaxID=3064253 RepID=UPI002740F052|nr:hypothetical protein [Streptomyces sp. MK5]
MELLSQLGRAFLEFTQRSFGALDLRLGLSVLFLPLPGALLGCFRLPLRLRRLPACFVRAASAAGLADESGVGVFWLRWRLSRARPLRWGSRPGGCLADRGRSRGEIEGRGQGSDEAAGGPFLRCRRVRQSRLQGLFDLALRGLPDGVPGLSRQGEGLLGECRHEGVLLPAEASELGAGTFPVSSAEAFAQAEQPGDLPWLGADQQDAGPR